MARIFDISTIDGLFRYVRFEKLHHISCALTLPQIMKC